METPGPGLTADEAPDLFEDAESLRLVIEAVPSFVMVTDASLRILYINRLQPGFSREAVLGRPLNDFMAPEYHEVQSRAVECALKTGQTQRFVVRGEGADGEPATYDSRVIAFECRNGRRLACVIALEITEHVARAEALQESEEQLRLAVDATGIGLWSQDLDTGLVEWNTRMHEITGHETPLTFERYLDSVHPDDRQLIEQAARSQAGIPEFVTHRFIRPDGSVRWLAPTGRLIQGARGQTTRIVGGNLDVTEQRELEERLRRAQKMDVVGALAAGVAHNFNNMLAIIIPAIELVLPNLTGPDAGFLRNAGQAARRAADIVAQLLTFVGHAPAIQPRVQPLGPIIQRAVAMCRRSFPPPIKIEFSIGEPAPLTRCDDSSIEQVVVNLLINARDAILERAPHDPLLRVTLCESSGSDSAAEVEQTGRFACIRVEDNGSGMDENTRRRLFEPFFTTKEPGAGTGLGLATSAAIVRMHGGFLQVESRWGEGTRIEVCLPILERA